MQLVVGGNPHRVDALAGRLEGSKPSMLLIRLGCVQKSLDCWRESEAP